MNGNFSKSMGITDTNSDEIIRTVNFLKSNFSKAADDISKINFVINYLYRYQLFLLINNLNWVNCWIN